MPLDSTTSLLFSIGADSGDASIAMPSFVTVSGSRLISVYVCFSSLCATSRPNRSPFSSTHSKVTFGASKFQIVVSMYTLFFIAGLPPMAGADEPRAARRWGATLTLHPTICAPPSNAWCRSRLVGNYPMSIPTLAIKLDQDACPSGYSEGFV